MYSHRILPQNTGQSPDFRVGLRMPSIEDLPQALTIAGTDYAPSVFMVGADINQSTGAWVGRDAAASAFVLAGSGADPVFGAGPIGTSATYSAKYHEAALAATGQLGATDFAMEFICRQDAGSCVAGTQNPDIAAPGFAVLTNAGIPKILLGGDGGFLYSVYYGAALSSWNHIFIAADRSENFRAYVNGALVTSQSLDPVIGTLTTAAKMRIGNAAGNETRVGGAVELCALWALAADPWPGAGTNAAVMLAIAAERFSRLSGTWPAKATTYAPVTTSRSVDASLDRYISSTERRIFTVGPNWIRTVERKDLAGVTVAGLLIEPQTTNLLTYSQALSGWTKVNITADSVANAGAPDGSATLNAIIADATAGSHGYTQAITAAGTTVHNFSCYAKKGSLDWLYLANAGPAAATAYFNLATGALGTVGADCRAYITDWGGGIYRCEIAFTAVAEAKNNVIYSAEANGDITFAGDTTSKYTYIWGAQLEDGVERASSYVPTVAAAVTRTKDQLQYSATGNVTAGTGAVEANILIPAQDKPAAGAICAISNAGSATKKFQIDVLASDKAHCTSVVSTVQASVVNAADVADGYRHKVMGQWARNDVRCYVDSVESSARDTVCSIATSMTVIDVGQDTAAANQIGAVINDLRIYRKPLKS